jgi:AraC-like DNA-binding protein
MASALHIVCPHCDAINRVPPEGHLRSKHAHRSRRVPQRSEQQMSQTVSERTPYGYVVARRLLLVSEALQRSDLSLSEIALAAGFRNLSTLTNTFKRHHGVTPSAYRARVR